MASTVGIGDPINEVVAAHYQKHPEQWQHKPCAREHEPGYVCVRLDGHDRRPAPSLGAGSAETGGDECGDLLPGDENLPLAQGVEDPSLYGDIGPLGAGSAGDVDALTVVLRRGAHNVRSEDESRHEAQARAILTSDWFAAHVARAPTADRERVARVEALADEWDRRAVEGRNTGQDSPAHAASELRAALAAPHVEPSP